MHFETVTQNSSSWANKPCNSLFLVYRAVFLDKMQPPTFSPQSSKSAISFFSFEGTRKGTHVIMLPMERERQVKKSVCQMICLIVAQFVYLMSGSAIFMLLERESAQKSYKDALGENKDNFVFTRFEELRLKL